MPNSGILGKRKLVGNHLSQLLSFPPTYLSWAGGLGCPYSMTCFLSGDTSCESGVLCLNVLLLFPSSETLLFRGNKMLYVNENSRLEIIILGFITNTPVILKHLLNLNSNKFVRQAILGDLYSKFTTDFRLIYCFLN